MKKYNTIYGLNNSLSFFKYKDKYKIESIFVCKGSLATKNQELQEIFKKNDFQINYLQEDQYKNKFKLKHDQGIVVFFSGSLANDLYEVKIFKNNHCFIICDQINDPQNLGQIVRTSECAGIDGIILAKHGGTHITDSVLQVSQGAFFYMDIFVETNLSNTIKYLKTQGFWVVGVENGIKAKDWYNIDYSGKIVIIIGSEGKGIRHLIKKSCDFLTTIPMKGHINSLNVSAAISAILFERQRQLNS